MSEVNELIKKYLLLVLALAEHNVDFLDTYYGPNSIREEAKSRGKVDLKILLRDAQDLISLLQENDLFEIERKDYLYAQLLAVETTIRMQLGSKMTVEEKVENIFGFKPERVNESEFEEAYHLLNTILPGKGSITERIQTYNDTMKIPITVLEDLCKFVINELRDRTRQRFGLPDGEHIDLQLVKDRVFTAALYYKGEQHSVLELNTEAPFFYLHYLINLIAHELYPGHHTEFCLKEVNLVQRKSYQEFWAVPSLSPQIFMAEMIASHARKIIMPDDEFDDWFRHQLLPKSKFKVSEVGEPVQMEKALWALAPVSTNAVFMYWDEGAEEQEIKEYYRKYRHYTEEQAIQAIQVVKDPVSHVYAFSYNPSYLLLKRVLSRSSDPYKIFRRLLNEAHLPSTILSW